MGEVLLVGPENAWGENRAGVVSVGGEGENQEFLLFLPATAPKKKRTQRRMVVDCVVRTNGVASPHQQGQTRHQEQKQPDAVPGGRPSGPGVSAEAGAVRAAGCGVSHMSIRVCRGRRSVASQAATAAWLAGGRVCPTKAGGPTGATDRRAVAGVVTRRSECDHSQEPRSL